MKPSFIKIKKGIGIFVVIGITASLLTLFTDLNVALPQQTEHSNELRRVGEVKLIESVDDDYYVIDISMSDDGTELDMGSPVYASHRLNIRNVTLVYTYCDGQRITEIAGPSSRIVDIGGPCYSRPEPPRDERSAQIEVVFDDQEFAPGQSEQDLVIPGTAAGSTTIDSTITRCSESLGTLVVNNQDTGWTRYNRGTNLPSLEPVIRQIVMQSGCFNMVADMNSDKMAKIRQLNQDARTSGDVAPDQGFEKDQRVPADFILFPEVNFAEQSCGGSNLLNRGLQIGMGRIFGNRTSQKIETRCVTVTMSLFDIRTSEQKGSSTGQGQTNNITLNFSSGGIFSGGASQQAIKTPEGKATLKALVEAYSKIVTAYESYDSRE